MQDIAIVTMEGEWFNDLERTLTRFQGHTTL